MTMTTPTQNNARERNSQAGHPVSSAAPEYQPTGAAVPVIQWPKPTRQRGDLKIVLNRRSAVPHVRWCGRPRSNPGFYPDFLVIGLYFDQTK
jgi:hypothetical protein